MYAPSLMALSSAEAVRLVEPDSALAVSLFPSTPRTTVHSSSESGKSASGIDATSPRAVV